MLTLNKQRPNAKKLLAEVDWEALIIGLTKVAVKWARYYGYKVNLDREGLNDVMLGQGKSLRDVVIVSIEKMLRGADDSIEQIGEDE